MSGCWSIKDTLANDQYVRKALFRDSVRCRFCVHKSRRNEQAELSHKRNVGRFRLTEERGRLRHKNRRALQLTAAQIAKSFIRLFQRIRDGLGADAGFECKRKELFAVFSSEICY